MTLRWSEVSRNRPCPICGKIDWCSVSEDGIWAVCRRLDTGSGKNKIDKAGADYWLYRVSDAPGDIPEPDLPDYSPKVDKADLDTLNNVYTALIKELNLSNQHRNNLLERGLTNGQVDYREYRTLAMGRSKIAKKLIRKFGKDICASVPGIYLKDDDPKSKPYWSIAGPGGILIPVRDHSGRIVALKVRQDSPVKGPKYLYVSSKKHDGPGPGSPVHIPLFEGSADIVRLTEGELKADITTILTGILTISIPGVSTWRPALPTLKKLGAKIVRVAFDADYHNNPNVARALNLTLSALIKEGFEVEVEEWAEEDGKGIDDLLVNGKAPRILSGEKALKTLDEILKTFELKKNETEEIRLDDARVKIKQVIEKLKEKQNPVVFFSNFEAQQAVGILPSAEQSIFWAEAKEACPRLNLVDARRAVKEACGEVKRKKTGSVPSQGLIQRNGTYCIEKMTAEGPIIVPISNFVLEPKLKLIMPDKKEALSVDVFVNGSDNGFERLLGTGDLLGRRELLRALGSVTAQWTGNDSNVQQLVGHMANVDVPTKKGVPFMGFYEDRFITPDGIFTSKGIEEKSDYVHVLQGVVLEDYVKFPKCDDWRSLAKQILEKVLFLQPGPVILPIIGWFFSCPAAPILRKRWNEFPIMHAWGTGGSGKTSIIQMFMNMLGVTSEPFSTSIKEFAMIKLLSCTNSLPVFLDEYRPQHMEPKKLKSFHEKLLLIYKASKESRGRPDQTTVEYQLMAPVIIAGEAPLPETETGLQERVLQIKFDRNFLDNHPEAEDYFNDLIDLPLEEFAGGYVTWLLKQDILDLLKSASETLKHHIKGIKVPIRVKHNLSIMLTGIMLFGQLAEELGVTLPRFDFVGALRHLAGEDDGSFEPRNAVDRFMLHMEAMAHGGDIRQGVDYMLDDNDGYLYFHTNAVISEHARWCKIRGMEGEMINDRSLRVMMSENPGKYVVRAHGLRKRIGDSNVRCTVINAKKLEQVLGISLDTWRDTQQRNISALTDHDRYMES